MFGLPHREVRFNFSNMLECVYTQQKTLAEIDKSFIRILPTQQYYTRESVKEAIYYAQCADIEVYEYQMAKPKDKLYEAVDVAIFTLNILAYLGCRPGQSKVFYIKPIKSTKKVLVKFHKLLSEILYYHIDYKQWKFAKNEVVEISLEVEKLLYELARCGLALVAYEASIAANHSIQPETILANAIIHKMQISRHRAQEEANKHILVKGGI